MFISYLCTTKNESIIMELLRKLRRLYKEHQERKLRMWAVEQVVRCTQGNGNPSDFEQCRGIMRNADWLMYFVETGKDDNE